MLASHPVSKWYMAKLRSNCVATNIASAAVLMTMGDLTAQAIQHQKKRQQPLECDWNTPVLATSSDGRTGDLAAQESSFWNPTRSATMAAWAAFAYTPFYLGLYRLYDRYLPKRSALGIGSRMFLSFLSSVPVNAAFYTYGTTINTTLDWFQRRRDLLQFKSDMGMQENEEFQTTSSIPFPLESLLEDIGEKLHAELPRTVTNSAICWIPLNMVNFTVVPPHLRPVTLMTFSAFWNCYLSLSQYRDVPVHEDVEPKAEALSDIRETKKDEGVSIVKLQVPVPSFMDALA